MQRRVGIVLLLAVTAGSFLVPAGQPGADTPPATPDQVLPEDVIAARQALMTAIEALMQPIDTFTVDDTVDPDLMRANANAISAMLLAVPHLFPQSTNRYDPADQYPATLALPAVWESYAAFYTMASAASNAAVTLAEAADVSALRAASLGLRATCDACHATYLLPYEPAGVTQDDLDFDFDSIFENN